MTDDIFWKQKRERLNKRQLGSCKEKLAADYLLAQGYRILDLNYRCLFGEIDIIAEDGLTLVFVEVKYRKNALYGYPAEAVTYSKQRRICRTADYYRIINHIPDGRACRFDVISVLGNEITLYRNAFLYI